MIRPGGRLRAFAARWCDAATLERVIDPLIADLQTEHADAVRHGRIWRSRAVRIVGYIAFVNVAIVCAWQHGLRGDLARTADRQTSARRALGYAAAATAVATLALTAPFWRFALIPETNPVMLMALLIPQALPIAIPAGFTLGVMFALRGRVVSTPVAIAVLMLAAISCGICFVLLSSVVPASNQAFRAGVYGGQPARTVTEMTLAELRQRVDTYENIGQPTTAARAAIAYDTRWALSFTAIVLAIFILSVTTRRGIGRMATALLIAGGYAVYQGLVFGIVLPAWTVPEASYQRLVFGIVPPAWMDASAFLLAWLPNITLMTVAALSFATRPRRSADAS